MFKALDKRPDILVPLLIFFMSAVPLGGAYVSQYGFGYEPCPLCIYQRIPYWIIVGFSVVLMFARHRYKNINLFLMVCGILFLVETAIATFHVGVEIGYWGGLEGCRDDIVAGTVEDLKQALMDTPIARCDEPAFKILGISMAGWNSIYASASTILCFSLLRRYRLN